MELIVALLRVSHTCVLRLLQTSDRPQQPCLLGCGCGYRGKRKKPRQSVTGEVANWGDSSKRSFAVGEKRLETDDDDNSELDMIDLQVLFDPEWAAGYEKGAFQAKCMRLHLTEFVH